jgi:hypothetical protein
MITLSYCLRVRFLGYYRYLMTLMKRHPYPLLSVFFLLPLFCVRASRKIFVRDRIKRAAMECPLFSIVLDKATTTT